MQWEKHTSVCWSHCLSGFSYYNWKILNGNYREAHFKNWRVFHWLLCIPSICSSLFWQQIFTYSKNSSHTLYTVFIGLSVSVLCPPGDKRLKSVPACSMNFDLQTDNPASRAGWFRRTKWGLWSLFHERVISRNGGTWSIGPNAESSEKHL